MILFPDVFYCFVLPEEKCDVGQPILAALLFLVAFYVLGFRRFFGSCSMGTSNFSFILAKGKRK